MSPALRTSPFLRRSRAAMAAVGESTADTGPPGDRPCPAGPRGDPPSAGFAGAARGLLFAPGTCGGKLRRRIHAPAAPCAGESLRLRSGAGDALELRGQVR